MSNAKLPLIQGSPSKKGEKFYTQVNRIFENESKKNLSIRTDSCCYQKYRSK